MPDTAPVVRLIDDGIADPALHFALEEALARSVDEGAPSILRLRHLSPCALVGIHQDPAEDLDLPACRAEGIPVLRRHNPGGAVYQDEGSFCFSLFAEREWLLNHLNPSAKIDGGPCPPHLPPKAGGLGEPIFSKEMGVRGLRPRWGAGVKPLHQGIFARDFPETLYPLIARAVVDTCAAFGVRAEGSPVNDVTIGGRKVYGSAQVSFGRALVHSGTFLVRADLDRMQRLLRPSNLKFADKGFKTVRERVVNLAEAADRSIDIEQVKFELSRRLSATLGITLERSTLTETERSAAMALCESKYGRPEWTFRARASRSTVLSAKANSGVVTLAVDREDGRITAAECRGDFLIHDSAPLADALGKVRGLAPSEAAALLGSAPLPEDLRVTLASLFRELSIREDAR